LMAIKLRHLVRFPRNLNVDCGFEGKRDRPIWQFHCAARSMPARFITRVKRG